MKFWVYFNLRYVKMSHIFYFSKAFVSAVICVLNLLPAACFSSY